jgi:CheY-like chemotaxis protein
MSVILIIEDDEQVRVLAESVLRDAGYEVLAATAQEGAQALLNSDQSIDLVFVDVNLGGRFGGRASNSAKRTGAAAMPACRLHIGPRIGRWQEGAVCRPPPLSSETIYIRAAQQFRRISSKKE